MRLARSKTSGAPLPPNAARGMLAIALVGGAFAGFRAWPRHHQLVHESEVVASPQFWPDNGFVEMTPPLRLPGRAAAGLETSVWLRLPTGATLTVTRDATTQRSLLGYPEGTEAVRVETFRDPGQRSPPQVADARGIHFLAHHQQRFYVLRPAARTRPQVLHGFAWVRGDEAAQGRASQLLSELAAKGLSGGQADAAAARVRGQNACARCHTPARPDARRPGELGEVARGTDAAGLFQIQTVLADHAPLEAYAPREQNLGDPNIVVRCGAELARERATRSGPVFVCSSGDIPVGYFAVAAALKAGDPRALSLCNARRYLFEHLSENGRRAFDDAFVACGISTAKAK